MRCAAALVLLGGLAACGGQKDEAAISTTAAPAAAGATITTAAGSTGSMTASTVFPADALNVCAMLLTHGADRLLNAPPTAEPLPGAASKSRGSCDLRSESTQLRVAQFPAEELADHLKSFSDAKACENVEGWNGWPEGCMTTPTGGVLFAFQDGTALQVVAVKATGSGLKPMAGKVNDKGIILVSGLETAKTQRSAGVLLGLL